MKKYGFEIGQHVVDIDAKSEKKALIKLVKSYFDLIDSFGEIELLGEVSKKPFVEELPEFKGTMSALDDLCNVRKK